MNYQRDNPNAPRERQPSGTGSQQSTGGQSQQPHTQQQPQQRFQQPSSHMQQQQWQQPQGQQPQGRQQQGRQPQGQQPQGQQHRQSHHQTQGQPQKQPQSQTQQSGTKQTPMSAQQTPGQQPPTGQQQAGGAQTQLPQQGTQQQGIGQSAGMTQQGQPQAGMARLTFEPSTVEDLIETDVVTAQADTPIRTVVSSMAEKNVGSVVILDDDGETPIDLVTDRKIALSLEGRPDIAEQNVEELLTGDLVVGTTEITVFEALDKLSESEIRRLPIVDENGTLQGIVTLDDLLVFLGTQQSDALKVISAQCGR